MTARSTRRSDGGASGERCSPHPHVFSDRILRPGDPAFFDILHSYNGYRTCYYRTFAVGKATRPQIDAYQRALEIFLRRADSVDPADCASAADSAFTGPRQPRAMSNLVSPSISDLRAISEYGCWRSTSSNFLAAALA